MTMMNKPFNNLYMLTAKKARSLVENRHTITAVLDKIKQSANAGYISVDVEGGYNKHSDKLKALGYSVGPGPSPGGGCSSTIRIMW